MAADESGFLQSGHFMAREKAAWWDAEETHTFPADRELTVTEAMQETGLDYELSKKPNFVNLGTDEEPNWEQTDTYSIIRPPVEGDRQRRIFKSSVSEQYGLLQNMDLARILDGISDDWPVETCGALSNGKKVFVLLKLGTGEVAGTDPVENYFLATDDKTGGAKATLKFTSTRVVCANTLHVAMTNRTQSQVSISHTTNVEDEAEFFTKMLHRAEMARQSAMDAFDAMAGQDISDEELDEFLGKVYPEPNETSKVQLAKRLRNGDLAAEGVEENQKEIAKQALERYEKRREKQLELRETGKKAFEAFNDRAVSRGDYDLTQTVWGAYNAVAESASWRPSKNEAIRGRAVLAGSRADEIRNGFDAAIDLLD